MKSFKRIALASIIRRAKDLSDDEILSLYHAVKEKLNPASQEYNQVLEGDQSGTEPQTKPEDNADQAGAGDGDGDGQGTDSIDSLLDDLGLGENSEDTLAPSTAPADTQAETPSQPSATEPEKPESTPAPAAEPEPAKDDLKTPVMDIPTPASKPEEKTATEDPNADITAPETPIPSLPPEDNDKAVQELLGINLEEATEPEVKESNDGDGDGEDNEMIQRLTQKIVDDDPYSPKNFKTASQGLQLNRKDKDTMSDGIVKPKYEETEFRPPREDRDPNGERYKKNEKNRDPDVDSDPDMKTASGNWSQYLKHIPEHCI